MLERVSPLKFTVEEPRTEVDPSATPPGESEPLRKVELFSATSIRDQGDSAHVMQDDVGEAGKSVVEEVEEVEELLRLDF